MQSESFALSCATAATNLARVAAVATGNESSTLTPDKAIDSNTGTRWSSNFVDSAKITVDLGHASWVSGVQLVWNSASSYSKAYTIELSTDNTTFVSAYSQAAGTGGTSLTETVTLATPGVARWVRLNSTKRSATYGISLKEFYIKGASLSASCGPGCTVTADCASGQTCNTTTGACSAATGCTKNSDCTGGKLCAGTGQCVTMASSFDPILSNAHTKSFKRGFTGNLCGPGGTKYGQRDLDLVKGGVSWHYNWGAGDLDCAQTDPSNSIKNSPDLNNYADDRNGVEFVPMIWGFNYGQLQSAGTNLAAANHPCADDGTGHPKGACLRTENHNGWGSCDAVCSGLTGAQTWAGSACYDCRHEAVTWQEWKNRMPKGGARYLLCGNEPSLRDQAGMTSGEFATMYKYCELMASEIGAQVVAPATEDCGTTDCTPVDAGVAVNAAGYINSAPLQRLEWTRLFYKACSHGQSGRAGTGSYASPGVGDCKIDYNGIHSYASNYASNYVLGSIATWQTSNLTTGETSAEAARLTALSNKPYWITEFGGWYAYQEDNAVRWANLDLDAYEASPLVFRYALFQAHTEPGDIYALSYMSLLAGLYTSGNSAVCAPNVWGRTWVGACYLTHPIGIANASATTPSTYCVANAAAGIQDLPATCPVGATKVPRVDNPPLTQAEIKAVSTMPPSPALPAAFGPGTCPTCLPL